MGYYINPKDETKEAFLLRKGIMLPEAPAAFENTPDGMLAVCLVDNGPFTGAAIAYSKRELEVFKNTNGDPRPRWWFLVKIEDLLPVSDLDMERIQG